jgi:hypothetical protein
MTTLPLMMAMIATSLTVSLASAAPMADFNNDGNVDATDLVALVGNLNASCEDGCLTDLNEDGYTDIADLMELMSQWGPVPNWSPEETVEEEMTQNPTPTRDENRDMSWQGQAPVLLDAIYYDQLTEHLNRGGYDRWHTAIEYNQGEFTKAWATENNVDVLPMVYGAFDWDEDGEFSDEDKANFAAWMEVSVPADYDGPICLDLEGEWWPMLDSQSQPVVDVALNFYLEGLEYAQSLRPNAKIGFWGLPKKSHTNPEIPTASIQRLLNACTAIFPEVYENNPGSDDSARIQLHIERAIAMVEGEVPVYAQTFPRYKVGSNGYRNYHTVSEFVRDQVQSSLDAVWTDSEGTEHRVSGVSMWDAYVYAKYYTENWSELSMEERKAMWDEIDHTDLEFLTEMKALVDVAVEAATQRLADAQEASTQSDTSASDVTFTAAQPTTSQQSGPVRQLGTTQSPVQVAAASYRSSSKSYRSSRRSWTQARRTFSAAQRKYSKGSRQYKRAYESYLQARSEMQSASEEYREDSDSTRSARATLNQAKDQWKTANADEQETDSTENTLVASK